MEGGQPYTILTVLWKERNIDHILRALLALQHDVNTLYRTDCLNGKSTSSDFNVIHPRFRGTKCSETAFFFYRWFYQFLNSMKWKKIWLHAREKGKELGYNRGRWAGQHILFPFSVGRQPSILLQSKPNTFHNPLVKMKSHHVVGG